MKTLCKIFSWKIMRHWLPIAGWLLCTYLFWIVSPGDKAGRRSLIYSRFHAFATAWFCLAYVLFNHCRMRRDLLQVFPVIISGFFSLAAGFLLAAYLSSRIPASMHCMLPDFVLLWKFYCTYLMAMALLLTLLSSLHSSSAPVLFAIQGVLTQGNLFLSEGLLLFPPASRAAATDVFLYCNPLVVASSCFSRYDYLRSSIFYIHSPLGTDIGSFRYPNAKLACAGYFVLAMFFLMIWCFSFLKRKKYGKIQKIFALIFY